MTTWGQNTLIIKTFPHPNKWRRGSPSGTLVTYNKRAWLLCRATSISNEMYDNTLCQKKWRRFGKDLGKIMFMKWNICGAFIFVPAKVAALICTCVIIKLKCYEAHSCEIKSNNIIEFVLRYMIHHQTIPLNEKFFQYKMHQLTHVCVQFAFHSFYVLIFVPIC